MAMQAVPYALQNASHSAAVFRQSSSFSTATAGVFSGDDFAVTQTSTPSLAVSIGAGKARIAGTSVSAPTGLTSSGGVGSALNWTTQGMYDVLNDATITPVALATANATNPRIDLVYVQVQDAAYSGSTNTAVTGVVTGTPAASPAVPATPANALALAQVTVAANATSVTSANITRVAPVAKGFGFSRVVADLTALAALNGMAAGDFASVTEGGAIFRYTGSAWSQETPSSFASITARNTAYAKASGVYLVANVEAQVLGVTYVYTGTAWSLISPITVASSTERDTKFTAPVMGNEVFRSDTRMRETYYDATGTPSRPAGWYSGQDGGLVPIIPASVVYSGTSVTVSENGKVSFTALTDLRLQGVFTSAYDQYLVVAQFANSASMEMRVRLMSGSTIKTGTLYGWTGVATTGGTPSYYSGAGLDWFAFASGMAATGNYSEVQVINSQNSSAITRMSCAIGSFTSNWFHANYGGAYNDYSVVDGYNLYSTSSAYFTGSIHVYGYRK